MNPKTKKVIQTVTAAIVALNLAGCASIVSGGPGKNAINTQPEGASISVFDKDGNNIVTQVSPTVLKLNRSAGYFQAASYKVVIFKECY